MDEGQNLLGFAHGALKGAKLGEEKTLQTLPECVVVKPGRHAHISVQRDRGRHSPGQTMWTIKYGLENWERIVVQQNLGCQNQNKSARQQEPCLSGAGGFATLRSTV